MKLNTCAFVKVGMKMFNKLVKCLLRGDFETLRRSLNVYLSYLLCFITIPRTYYLQNIRISSMRKNTKSLIVYLIPPEKRIDGGVKSIYNMCSVTRKLLKSDDCDVLLVTYPSILSHYHNDLFPNSEVVFRFSQLRKNYPELDSLVINIEHYVKYFGISLSKKDIKYLQSIPNLQINAMNQNSICYPKPQQLQYLYSLTPNITQTTAFARDTTQERANLYNMPVHLFGAMDNPYEYHLKTYSEKKNIIVLSPDSCPFMGVKGPAMVRMIRSILSEQLPDYQQIVVSNMKYADYLTLISDAKYTITFGEGYDGYFVQPHLSGSLSFTVYNDMFFPHSEWCKFPNVFPSYEKMAEEIVDLIHHFDSHPNEYAELNKKICDEYSVGRFTPEIFSENLLRYYRGEYDYVPQT